MSALAVMPSEDRFVIASDGAVCSAETGALIGFAAKTVLIPEWSCVFAARGFAGIAQAIYRHVGWRKDFDDLLTVIGPASQDLHQQYIEHYDGKDCHWSMTILGWSALRQRPEMYWLRSREYAMANVQTNVAATIAPFELHDGGWSMYAAPMPNPSLRERFGVDLTKITEADPVDLTCRLVAAARLERDAEFSDIESSMIGGFIQSTILTPTGITTNIVHRYNDEFGKQIVPSDDEIDEVKKSIAAHVGKLKPT